MPDRQLMERDDANDPPIDSRIDNQDLAHQANRKSRPDAGADPRIAKDKVLSVEREEQ